MTNYARIINNVAVDVSKKPAEQFHPTIAAAFVAVPPEVEPQWQLVAGQWVAPQAPGKNGAEENAPVPRTVGPNEFYFLWTIPEQVAIDSIRETDVGVKLFMRRLDDPRTTEVVLADPTVQQAIKHTVDQLVAAGVIPADQADARAAAIIAGARA